MWMGTSATSLIQIKDNINTNTTYTLTKSGSTITLKGSDGSSVNVTDSNTIYNNATASAAGLMSAADKSKLDRVATGANKTVVDTSFVANSTNPVQSKVVKSALDGKSDTGHKHVKADITDFPTSMPASDVSAWAKAATKPSYSKAEVGLGNVNNTADANKSVKYATSAGNASTATTVVNGGAASADVACHVWFSDSSNETARVSDDNFKYNPSGNLLTTNISGNAATASSVTWGNVSGKPSSFTPASHTHDNRYYTESEINTKLNAKANSSHTHTKSQITDFPTSMPASDVYAWAKASSKPSYSWSEISNKPSIPSVGNGTVTIKQKGATKGSFTLNQSGNATIELTDNNTVYSLHAATSSTLGGVKVGSNITNNSGTISLTKANVTAALGYTPPTSDTNTWRPEEVIISSTQPSANTCKLWIKI
nr:MAG TPA: receptor binding complex [Caudoviricetes sp.]